MFGGTGGDFDPHDGALRAADAVAAKDAERRRAGRLPPIRSDRPWGSYRGALVLSALATAGAALLMYDLGVIRRSETRASEGVVTLVTEPAPPGGVYHLAVAYEDDESVLTITAGGPMTVLGDRLTVVTHSRYGNRHPRSVRASNGTGSAVLYLEPEHGFGVSGAIAIVRLSRVSSNFEVTVPHLKPAEW